MTGGMSDNEIRARRDEINAAMQRRVGHDGTVFFWEQTVDEIHERRELDCRDMINSCLAYGSAFRDFYCGELVRYGLNYRKPLEGEKVMKFCTEAQRNAYALSDERVIELYQEQVERFKMAKVRHNVHTDYEGCSYNSVEWDAYHA